MKFTWLKIVFMIKILFLSNLIYSKGVLNLLDALKELDKDIFSLSIAGEFVGDEYLSSEEIKRVFIEKLSFMSSLKYNIEYLGPIYGEKKKELYSECDIYCLPTFYRAEACPIVLMEAVKSNCVVVTSDWKYLKNYSKNSLIYVDPNSVLSLKNELLALNSIERRRKRLALQETWKQSFKTAEYTANKIINIIKIKEC